MCGCPCAGPASVRRCARGVRGARFWALWFPIRCTMLGSQIIAKHNWNGVLVCAATAPEGSVPVGRTHPTISSLQECAYAQQNDAAQLWHVQCRTSPTPHLIWLLLPCNSSLHYDTRLIDYYLTSFICVCVVVMTVC